MLKGCVLCATKLAAEQQVVLLHSSSAAILCQKMVQQR